MLATLFAAYQPVWRAGFIWDDDDHVTGNACVVGPLGLKEIWTTSAARICPLVLSSFRVQHALWGLKPLPYHLVTLLMHGLAAVVLWRVLLRLQVPGAWFGAALWALHPVQVESAAWITELKNTQSGLFYMLTVLFFARARLAEAAAGERVRRRNDWIAVGFGVLAMASKSSTVILPLTLGLCAWWIQRGWRWRDAVRLVPFLALAALSSGMAIWTQGGEGLIGPEWDRTWPHRIAAAGNVVWFYLGKLCWPHPLIFVYPKWAINPREALAYMPLALVLVTLAALWLGRRRWGRGAFMSFACFLAALLPVLGILDHYFLCYSFVGDHFQYLASAAPLALAGGGLWSALGKIAGGSPFIRPAACGLVLAGLGFLTWRHAAVFKDDESLWRDTLAKNPACWMAHNNWGYDLADLGQAEAAKAHYLAALQAYPNFPEAHFNLAAVLLGEGNTEAATQHYLAAISAKPGFAEAHSDLSNLLVKQGDTRGAIQHAAEAIRLRPNYPQAHFNLGNALNSQGQLTNAVAEYAAAVRLRPNYAEARYNLGCALYLLGRADEAVAQLSEVILLQPANAAAGCKLAFILAARGRGREAINLYREVLRQQPEFGAAWRGLAWLLATDPQAELRDGPEAVRLATRAAELAGSANARALDTLAAAYAEAGRFAEAAATARQAQALAAAQGQEAYAEEIGRRLALYGDNLAYRGGAMSP